MKDHSYVKLVYFLKVTVKYVPYILPLDNFLSQFLRNYKTKNNFLNKKIIMLTLFTASINILNAEVLVFRSSTIVFQCAIPPFFFIQTVIKP